MNIVFFTALLLTSFVGGFMFGVAAMCVVAISKDEKEGRRGK